jgi:hypothetical protein
MSCPPEQGDPLISKLPLVCSPPRLAADTRGKRLADRLLPTGPAQWIFFAAVAAALFAAGALPLRAGLILDLVATLAASGWCLTNFWRCREAHCIVTGAGWLPLAGLDAVEAGLGRSFVFGDEGLIFVAILVVGICFEALWRNRHGTNALILERR